MSIDTQELDLAVPEQDRAPAWAPPEPPAPPGGRSASNPSALRVALVAIALAAVLAPLYLWYWPQVQKYWYSTRQRNLSSDFVAQRPGVPLGHAFGVLQMIKYTKATASVSLFSNLMVIEGERASDLRGAPGHRVGTPKPGRRGNTVIVGHRDQWGAPFAKLGQLHKGDVVILQAHLGKPIVYTVVSVKHVGADAPRLVADSTDHRLTLVTHDGGALSDSHIVVSAVSGTVGKLKKPTPGNHLDPPRPSVLAWPLAVVFVCFGLAGLALHTLRRRYSTLPVALIVGPLAAAGLLGLLVELGAFFPPLR